MQILRVTRSWVFRGSIVCVLLVLGYLSRAEAQQVRWSTSLGSAVGPGSISPEIGELDGNSANGLEVVAGTRDGVVTALSSSGAILWQSRVPSTACSNLSRTDMMRSSPSIGQLRQGEAPVVVVGYGSMGSLGCDGGVIAFDGPTGQEKWRFSVKQHAKKRRYWAFRYGTVGKPAISRPLAGGRAMVAFGSLSRYIYLLDDKGVPRYYYQAADTVFSSPTFFRDARGRDVFAIGQDISANGRLRPPTRDGGYLDVFALGLSSTTKHSSQVPFRRIERAGKAGLISLQRFDQVVQSSPQVDELVDASAGPEMAVTSGCFFPQNSSQKRGRAVTLVDSLNRRVLAKAPLSACSASSPLLFNQEQILAVLDNGMSMHGGPGSGKVIGFRPVRDSAPGKALRMHFERVWEQTVPDTTYWQSPAAVTLSSGERAVAMAGSGRVYFFRASDGQASGSVRVDGSIMDSSLSAGDIDGDSRSEVAVVSAPGEETRVTLISVK